MFIRRTDTSLSGSGSGCDLVEMYFDPCGKESVVDCLLGEGHNMARAKDSQGEWNGDRGARDGLELDKSGVGMELHNWNENGTDEHSETAGTSSAQVIPRKRARNLMSMVTSALQQLEVADS